MEMHLINSKKVHIPDEKKKRSGFVFESLTILKNINKNLVDFAMWGSLKTQLAHCLLCFPVLWHSFNLKPLDYHVSLDLVRFGFHLLLSLKKIQKTRFYKLHRNHQASSAHASLHQNEIIHKGALFLNIFFFAIKQSKISRRLICLQI